MQLSLEVENMLTSSQNLRKVWETHDNGRVVLRWAGEFEISRPLVILAACACARLVLKYIPAGEMRPERAIETAERWAIGEATVDQVCDASLSVEDLYRDGLMEIINERSTRNAAFYAVAAATQAVKSAATSNADEASIAAMLASVYAVDAEEEAAKEYGTNEAGDSYADFAFAATYMQRRCSDEVRRLIAWPIVAHALVKAKYSLGESWLDTVAAHCRIDNSTVSMLTPGARESIEKISIEMAEKGRWDAKVLEPLWKSIERQPVVA